MNPTTRSNDFTGAALFRWLLILGTLTLFLYFVREAADNERRERILASEGPVVDIWVLSEGLKVIFEGADSYSANRLMPIIRFDWKFGDGHSAVGPGVYHRYANPGEYDVTLTITDEAGRTATGRRRIAIARFL